MDIYFIKIGGSLITDKTKPYTAREDMIEKLAKEVADIRKKHPHIHLIIGTGAGSFAHTSAARFATHKGAFSEEEKLGGCQVRYDAVLLHQMLCSAFIKEQVPAFGVSVSSFLHYDKDGEIHGNPEVLLKLLNKDLLPLVYGDVLVDEKNTFRILSTDVIGPLLVDWLSTFYSEHKILKIIHLGDYEGVLDVQGNVIEKIDQAYFASHGDIFRDPGYTDVTGGMMRKVDEMLKIAQTQGVESIIVSGARLNILEDCLFGTSRFGTRIVC